MLRKSVFDKYGLRYDPNYVACEDYELWSRAARYTKAANLPEILLKYRWHDSNISVRQKRLQTANTMRVRKNIIDFCIKDEQNRKRFKFFAKNGTETALSMNVRIFGFVPFLKISAIRNKKEAFLFNFFPLIRIKNGKAWLFFLIPIAKIGEVE
jgi:hypothetical protein